MRFLFVMDSHQSMHPTKDTSFAFMRAAQERGHRCFHCLVPEVGNEGRDVHCYARPITVAETSPHVTVGDTARHPIETFDAIFIRKDPPFDSHYLHLTQQLDLVEERRFIMNSTSGLRMANEKLYTFHFAPFMPRSLVSSSTDELLQFVARVGGRAVVKPLDGAGGAGVMGLDGHSRNSRGIIDYVTREGAQLALVQEFQPEVVEGDKRVLLLDGQPLGAIRRVPRADDIRANIHVGGRVEACDLTDQERAMIAQIGPRLVADGLYFVGLDLIGGKLIEVNVTSPTGIQELARLTNLRPDLDVIRFVERHAATRERATTAERA